MDVLWVSEEGLSPYGMNVIVNRQSQVWRGVVLGLNGGGDGHHAAVDQETRVVGAGSVRRSAGPPTRRPG
jgi:hypothetical protein